MQGDVFDKMAKNWCGQIVPRTKIEEYTGGLLTPKTLANLDSLGIGPERITVGRRVAYPVDELNEWLRERCRN